MSKLRRLVLVAVAVLAILVLAGYFVVDRVQDSSWRFFYTGSNIADRLGALSTALEARDREKVASFFSSDFSGKSLGLNNLKLVREKDGIRELAFQGGGSTLDRDGAVNEWLSYLGGFSELEELALYIHRLEKWESNQEWTASIRFEVLGTPREPSGAGVDRGYFRFRFEPGDDPLITGCELIEAVRAVSPEPHFVSVGAEAGIDFENQFYPEFLKQDLRFAMIMYGPGGITAVDYDNDTYYDLFIPDGVESRLFRNNADGTFTDVTAEAGLSGLDGVSVGVFADYDNDGYKDAFISRTFKPNQLFRNNGDGTFTDVTAQSGIGEDCCTTVASWADYNNDGYLDLYVGRYLDPRIDIPTTFYARNGEPNQLYRNNGDGTFTNVTVEAGVGETGLCLGTVFGDYNNDGYPDLYVVNDFGRNTLYRNNGDGTFTDVTVKTGTLAYGAGMNASMGDYDNDGQIDVYVTNIRSEHAWFAEAPTIHRYMYNSISQGVWASDMPLYMEIFRQSGFGFVEVFQQMASGNTLLRNKGDGTFEDVTWSARANPPGWFWGAGIFDFDNDGWQDIYAANGWVYNDPGTEIELDFLNNVVSKQDEYKTGKFFDPDHFGQTSWHGWERNRYLRNNGDGTFIELGRPTGADLILNSRGIAVADYWNRGIVDVAVAASTDRHALLKNQIGDRRNWLAIDLQGTKSNRDAVGARVIVKYGDRQAVREVMLGDGYGSQNTLRLYFGIDDAEKVDQILVKWPASGIEQTFTSVAANQFLKIVEGNDILLHPIASKEAE
jgi:hypothetical protein